MFCLQSRHRRTVQQIKRRQASAVVAAKHEKNTMGPGGKRERVDQSAILPEKVGDCRRERRRETFQINSVKAEPG